MTKNYLVSLLTLAVIILAAPVPSHASFIKDLDPSHTGNSTKFYLDGVKDPVSSFTGHVGEQDEGPVVSVVTNPGSTVDVANGYATIKQHDGLLASLTFTPEGGVHFGDFSFRFQLNPIEGDVQEQTVNILVTANDGVFPFSYTFDKANADLGPIGVISTDLEWIESVMISTQYGFDQVKQIDFSLAGTEPAPVPEPGTVMLLGMGFAGLAIAAKRRRNA